MPTIPVEPDIGVLRDRIKDVEDLGTNLIVEVDTAISKPRPLGDVDRIALKMMKTAGVAPLEL
jgi:hypothetical protein